MSETTPWGRRAFFTILAGEAVSAIGSGLSVFGVGIWIYQRTGSVTRFSLLSLCMILPSIFLAPLAGVLVDRFDRRRIMMLANLAQFLIMLSFAPLIVAGRLETWYIYAAAVVVSALGMTNILAFNALITRLLSGQDLGRAAGLFQTITALAGIASPLLAAVLLTVTGLQGIVLVDASTFLFALITVLLVRAPFVASASTEQAPAKAGFSRSDLTYGWTYVRAHHGLLALLIFSAVMNFAIGLSGVTLTPLLLGICSPRAIGTIAAVGALGMLIGSIGVGVWGGPKRRIHGVLTFGLIMGLGFIVTGVEVSPVVIGVASCIIQFFAPITFSSNQAIWLNRTPSPVQGRVFAVRTMVQSACMPIAYLAGGPVSDRFFKPLLVAGGPLTGTVGRVLGVGPSRGLGLMFIVVGFGMLTSSVIGYLYAPLRRVDDSLPDAVDSSTLAPQATCLVRSNQLEYQPASGPIE
jgi:MFS family permease